MDEITKEGRKEKVITKWAVGYCRESKEKADISESLTKDKDIKVKDIAKDFVSISIANQEKGAKEQAEIDSLNLVRVFKDVNIQSTTIERPEFNNMLDFIKQSKDKVKKVYIKDYTRLGRAHVFFSLRRLLVRHIPKENIFFYHEPHSNRINIEEDSIIGIKVYAHYIMIERNRTEYQKMQERKQKHNIPYISPPYGYKWNKNKEWSLDKNRAEKVKRIFELTKQGKSYKEISEMFKISERLYYKIIRNKTYTGVVSHKQKIRDDEGTTLRIEKVDYKGKHQPIISSELFEEVQKIINERMWKPKK